MAETQYKIKRTIWGIEGHRKPEAFLKGTYTKQEFFDVVFKKMQISKQQETLQHIHWEGDTKVVLSEYHSDVGFFSRTYELTPLNDYY